MKLELIRMLVASSMLVTVGSRPCLAAPEGAGEQLAPPQQSEQAADPASTEQVRAAPGGEQGAAKTAGETDATPGPEVPPSDQLAPDPASAAGANAEGAPAPAGAAAAETAVVAETADVADKAPEPVTGAFGVPLGERFQPCMVAKVISQEEKTYRAVDKTERKGTLYRVEPKVPNMLFATYAVETTDEGIVYSILGELQSDDKASKCAVTKRIAASLQEKYGKPRAKGGFGEWYSFRDMSQKPYKGVRLFANRCRRGIYSIHYSDDNARTAAAPPPAEPTETSGL